MTTRFPQLVLFALSLTPLPGAAVLLDCEISPERVYTCIEIGDAASQTTEPEKPASYSEQYSAYIEQAKSTCVYKEPRRRAAGKNTGAALRTEELKSARAAYDKCVSDKARALWRAESNGDGATAGPPGE